MSNVLPVVYEAGPDDVAWAVGQLAARPGLSKASQVGERFG